MNAKKKKEAMINYYIEHWYNNTPDRWELGRCLGCMGYRGVTSSVCLTWHVQRGYSPSPWSMYTWVCIPLRFDPSMLTQCWLVYTRDYFNYPIRLWWLRISNWNIDSFIIPRVHYFAVFCKKRVPVRVFINELNVIWSEDGTATKAGPSRYSLSSIVQM